MENSPWSVSVHTTSMDVHFYIRLRRRPIRWALYPKRTPKVKYLIKMEKEIPYVVNLL